MAATVARTSFTRQRLSRALVTILFFSVISRCRRNLTGVRERAADGNTPRCNAGWGGGGGGLSPILIANVFGLLLLGPINTFQYEHLQLSGLRRPIKVRGREGSLDGDPSIHLPFSWSILRSPGVRRSRQSVISGLGFERWSDRRAGRGQPISGRWSALMCR